MQVKLIDNSSNTLIPLTLLPLLSIKGENAMRLF